MKPVICLSVLCFAVIFWISMFYHFSPPPRPLGISDADAQYIISELQRRSAGNCELTRTDYGYVCKEMATNKIYRIKM